MSPRAVGERTPPSPPGSRPRRDRRPAAHPPAAPSPKRRTARRPPSQSDRARRATARSARPVRDRARDRCRVGPTARRIPEADPHHPAARRDPGEVLVRQVARVVRDTPNARVRRDRGRAETVSASSIVRADACATSSSTPRACIRDTISRPLRGQPVARDAVRGPAERRVEEVRRRDHAHAEVRDDVDVGRVVLERVRALDREQPGGELRVDNPLGGVRREVHSGLHDPERAAGRASRSRAPARRGTPPGAADGPRRGRPALRRAARARRRSGRRCDRSSSPARVLTAIARTCTATLPSIIRGTSTWPRVERVSRSRRTAATPRGDPRRAAWRRSAARPRTAATPAGTDEFSFASTPRSPRRAPAARPRGRRRRPHPRRPRPGAGHSQAERHAACGADPERHVVDRGHLLRRAEEVRDQAPVLAR